MKHLALAAVAFAACAHARTPDAYRADTAALLAAHEPEIQACYQRALDEFPDARGHVVVHFEVEPKTGHLMNAGVDTAKTTAPDVVNQCVLHEIPQLYLSPGDRNRGSATWSWDFVARMQPARVISSTTN
ncbi:MAG TPA: hypothetical protein VLT45_22480 [Kofleriaceae bacterium]|nr:hypothetical protein [Kofleriaceae bacterium]